uniref:Uncharacterized protein n=1 Tax=Aegilops tauschii subsp. strangulata TaxID=200361 RepID=A0A453DGX5_AEGTS
MSRGAFSANEQLHFTKLPAAKRLPWSLNRVFAWLQALEISILPLLPGQPQKSKLRRPMDAHRPARRGRHGDGDEGEHQAPVHLHREAASRHAGQHLRCL